VQSWTALTLLCALGDGALGSSDEGRLEVRSIRLYLPDDEMERRMGADIEPLARYIKALETAAASCWRDVPAPWPSGLLVVVAVRPGRMARVWCEAVGGILPLQSVTGCERELGRVPPLDVRHEPIAFAIQTADSGAGPLAFPAMPDTWAQAARQAGRSLRVPDDVLSIVWPE
jgi:hypothetical protein